MAIVITELPNPLPIVKPVSLVPSLFNLVMSISLGFLLLSLVIVPPVFISWVAVLVLITRELKVVQKSPLNS